MFIGYVIVGNCFINRLVELTKPGFNSIWRRCTENTKKLNYGIMDI